jgi:hypothetical protein
MTPKSSDHERVRFLEEFVCDAIPSFAAPRERSEGPAEDGKDGSKSENGERGTKTDDLPAKPSKDAP